MRVYELAKEFKITSKDLIRELSRLKIKVKGHMSALDAQTVQGIRTQLAPQPAKSSASPKPKKSVKPAVRKPSPPKSPVQTKVSKQPPIEKPVKVQEPAQTPKTELLKSTASKKEYHIDPPITVASLATQIGVSAGDLIKRLMKLNIWLNMNQLLEDEVLDRLAEELNCTFHAPQGEHESLLESTEDRPEDRILRPPVVTFMGHVDHGKTSLLDAIRESRVVEKEAGKITQHIGAYSVALPKGKVTFLDTPGHEAFTAMRARGANATDVVVLVVAANDGLMPQTLEAIDHARAAKVPIVVAINKTDLPDVDMTKVRKQLAGVDLAPEDWGGKTIAVGVSAKTGKGIQELLEMLLLESELLELKANPKLPARGVVVEAKLSKGRGPVATVLVQSGTLRVGDVLVSGLYYGRIRAMTDDRGIRMKEAGPSDPAEIWGLSGVPVAGDEFLVVPDERRARELSLSRQDKSRVRGLRQGGRVSLEHLYENVQEGKIKELKIVLKADVQGSVEAITQSLQKLHSKAIMPVVIHSGVGGINESDVNLALASDAVIIGFHVIPTAQAEATAEKEGLELRLYDVIYQLVNEIKSAMEGMLEPTEKQVRLGHCKVLRTFKVSRVGVIAGCQVQKGVVTRSAKIHLIRNNVIINQGSIRSLKRFKEDTREVSEGMECGVVLTDFNDIKVGDTIEAFRIEKIAAKL